MRMSTFINSFGFGELSCRKWDLKTGAITDKIGFFPSGPVKSGAVRSLKQKSLDGILDLTPNTP